MIGVSMSTIIGGWLPELVGLLPVINRYTRSLVSLFHQSSGGSEAAPECDGACFSPGDPRHIRYPPSSLTLGSFRRWTL